MRTRWFSFIIVLVILVGCTGRSSKSALTKINLPMGYVANVQFSPFYMGKERGYFEKAGFDVTFDYRWETDGIQLVAAGEIPFSVASGDQVIQARSRGLPVVAVAAWYQKFPVAVIALENTPLNSPADMRGLRIGIPETFGASYIGLRALLKAGGLTEADIDLQTIGYTQLAALTAGTVDAVVVYANNEPVVFTREGTAFNALYVSNYANLVSAVIVSNDTMIKEHSKEVEAFVTAFLAGLNDVIADPDAAFKVCGAYIEGLEENAIAQRGVLDTSIEFWRTPHLGRFDAAAWEEAQTVMLEIGLIEKTMPVETLFTNAFAQ
ncbi:MAG TPA: ABC transporter substrate-binding protein [Anaerolineae bacterium]|nr:ABC transporter substrate-binding protein [Anaerolineae bacterium]HQI86729.1 ABC transporter substrate-binding protein [Anaerolineae bacterium]